MARLNWDRVRAENIVQRRRTVDSDDSVGIARETYASRLQAKGREYFEITSNKVVAEFLGCNPGQASNVRKAVAEKMAGNFVIKNSNLKVLKEFIGHRRLKIHQLRLNLIQRNYRLELRSSLLKNWI